MLMNSAGTTCAQGSSPAAAATIWKMQAVTRHKTLNVLSGYVREAEAFKDHAGQAFL
jgi:hypothetical protein